MQPQGQGREMAMQAFAQRAGQAAPQGQLGGKPGGQPSGQPGAASSGGIKQLQQSQPNEAVIIVKALIKRLQDLTRAEFGEKESAAQSAPQPKPQLGQ